MPSTVKKHTITPYSSLRSSWVLSKCEVNVTFIIMLARVHTVKFHTAWKCPFGNTGTSPNALPTSMILLETV
jgi:hypothetical protein